MNRILLITLSVIIALIPAGALAYLYVQPSADIVFSNPIFHFYVVTFTTFAAAVISILLAASLGTEAQPRHALAASAFAVIGGVFFSHGLATPNALIDHFHPAVQWSAWLTLFGGGALFACAALDGGRGLPGWLPVRAIIYASAAGVILYSAGAALTPDTLIAIGDRVQPWHQRTIFYITLAFWAFASVRLSLTAFATRNRVDAVLAFVSAWMITATISMHNFRLWNLSWWMYHIILLVGFVITMFVLAAQYEQVRQFRLRRYYLAASLIITALLALVASAFFTEFAYTTLITQIQSTSASMAGNIATDIAGDLPDIATADDLRGIANHSGIRAMFAWRITGLPVKDILVYDDQGVAAYASEPEWIGVNVESRAHFEAALRGEAVTEIRPPDDPPATYQPSTAVHIIETFAPLRPGGDAGSQPIGVLVIVEEAPQLGRAIINARVVGLITAASTMGLLFAALLIVVGRADRILTSRTTELTNAYANLRQAEAMRDDLTNMIVHDLRNPLTAISASLDFMGKLPGDGPAEPRARMVKNAMSASRRMTGMIEDLLTVGKIEAGEFKLQRQPTNIPELLNGAIGTFVSHAAADGTTLTLDCPPGLTASLDEALIRRVVENLIGNALKYVDSGGAVQVLAHQENGRLTVTVRDNGPGVPNEHKQRIFQKFIQLTDGSGRQARKGAGLGLAFCQLVVQQHGGGIKVEDAPGGGSDFVFWLPTNKG
ncbi:MAG TPA: HAMP domain-containing sensor histidine kinase [Anaerolineales bacterium]|nr:HAMP domain-containing sensor histidine kinase [Anaerolineales bacterium]